MTNINRITDHARDITAPVLHDDGITAINLDARIDAYYEGMLPCDAELRWVRSACEAILELFRPDIRIN